MGKMEVEPILPIKVTATIDTMLNFDCNFDRHGDVDVSASFLGQIK